MANIKLNLTAAPFTGQIVTFCAPCSCDAVTEGLVINGEIYTVCDGMGNCVTGSGGYWCEGAAVTVALDVENKKAYLQNTYQMPTAAQVNAVNKAGDIMTGDLTVKNIFPRVIVARIKDENETHAALAVNGTIFSGEFGGGGIQLSRNAAEIGGLYLGGASRKLYSFIYDKLNSKNYRIFDECSKPTGSYTGNGSSTSRTIETGGLGNVLAIYSSTGVVLVTPKGGFYGYNNSSFSHFPYDTAHFINGVLTIASTHTTLNTNGQEYTYQVL